jgi:Uma2 family endonuclease
MTTQLEKRYYTTQEYLALEEKAEFKNEYIDGEIVPMTGGTTNHNEISGNLYSSLKANLRRQNYRIYISDVRLWIPAYRIYTYPDIMIIQGEPVYEGKGITTVTNPLVIIEVLSNSTKNYDRAEKFKYYRSISSLQEYILIDQYSFATENFSKQAEGQWLLTECLGENQVLNITTIALQIVFNDLYEGVNFELVEEAQ